MLGGASKDYGAVRALDRVSLEVGAGDIYALLGLNGAGKTTLIRLVLGMVRPTAGSVEVLGRSTRDRTVWASVGYLVETASAYPDLTVRENLEVVRALRRLPRRAVVDEAIELFGLAAYAGRRARTLSLGNLQRLGLAKAMLHRPSLLVLDEPVNGLDPAGVVEVRGLLSGLARDHGATVLLSSHVLGEVARLATRIGVLHEGRLVDEFDASELSRRVHRDLEVSTCDDGRAEAVLSSAGMTARRDGGALRLDDDWAVAHPDAVATALVHGGTPPTRLTVVEEGLEDYFLRLVGSPAPVGEAPRDVG
jgi:ABC-2 type transport system ATP-binding protein